MPFTSIVIPLYNKVDYIVEAINSVIAQTFTDWEMVIVDNGSTDGSWEEVQKIKDSRLCLLQALKRGPGAARNHGLQHSKGAWIQFLDADDLLEPDHLEQQFISIRRHPEADILACCWQEFTPEHPTEKNLKHPAGNGHPNQVLRNSAIAFAPWAVHAAIIKRSVLSPDYYWDERLDRYLGEDIAFWFKLVTQYQVAYSKSCGALYRIQTTNCRTQNEDAQRWFQGVHNAIQSNLTYLKTLNSKYTTGQCGALVRAYSELYRLANQTNCQVVAQESLDLANKWLENYFAISERPTISMKARKFLGIDNFLKLSTLCSYK
ncbi:MAG: glycosyltransferase family 2 protein [Cyanobacteria bacterium P01_E01_bin.6]